MNFEYEWAMPNKETFKIKPIRQFMTKHLDKYQGEVFVNEIYNFGFVLDPFAKRKHEFASITNDINPDCNTHYNLDAIEFLDMFDDDSVDAILFDPPYSLRQLYECYDGIGKSLTKYDTNLFFNDVKDKIATKLKKGGCCISFGWSSVGLGKSRGYEKTSIMLVCHGGYHNDTIVLCEVKL